LNSRLVAAHCRRAASRAAFVALRARFFYADPVGLGNAAFTNTRRKSSR
jgi:hypothetical protein